MMKLEDLDRWWDQLSPSEQAELRAAHPPIDKLPKKLLQESHGTFITEHLKTASKRFAELAAAKKPFFLARVSDCEVAALGCHYYPHYAHPYGERVFRACGYDRNFLPHYRGELIQAFRDAHILGVQENWEPWRINTIAIFLMLGFPVPHPNAVDIHLPYKMLVDGSLFSFLEGKKVLLIGGLAAELARAWGNPAFQAAYKKFGPLDRVASIQAMPMPRRGQRSAYLEMDGLTLQIKEADFDVALLSVGVPAKILARRIWAMGKTALDVGFVFDALLGDNERTMRPVLKDTVWPSSGGW
jgi:hypothetical protein